MIHYITYLKDIIGNNYLGINIPNGLIDLFLFELEEIIDNQDEFEEYISNQKKRDLGSYHLTVINTGDYNKLAKEMGMDKFINSLESVFKYEISDLKMMGIGTAERSGNRTYFIVCKSDKINTILERYNLPPKDLHITIGFKWKDVYGVRKNEIIPKTSKFLKLLRNEYYKNENWNFLKRIGNYESNPESEIIPISIEQNYIKIKSDNTYMDIGILDDYRFWVFTRYPNNKELPRLPETEISKILNKKN
jgi:hypothetical protein